MSFAGRPATRAAALLWIWLTAMVAPVGATLHAMSHLASPPQAQSAPFSRAAGPQAVREAGPEDVARPGGDLAPDRDDGRHGAAAHCHLCDEWQFLDHVLPSAQFADGPPAATDSPGPLPLAARLDAETPWVQARAPPAYKAGPASSR